VPCKSVEIGAAIQKAKQGRRPRLTADIACLDKDAKVVTTSPPTTTPAANRRVRRHRNARRQRRQGPRPRFQQVESCTCAFKLRRDHQRSQRETYDRQDRLVKRLPCDGDKEKGKQSTVDALQAHPDLVGIFAMQRSRGSRRPALLSRSRARPSRSRSVGLRRQPEGKKAILEGKIYADPIQHPDQIARKTADAILGLLSRRAAGEGILIRQTSIASRRRRKT